MRRLVPAVVLSLSLAALTPVARAADVLVFAAASTADALGEVNRAYGSARGVRVAASFASSGMLARQIDQGAPADLILSANPEWIDYLDRRGRLVSGSRRKLMGNQLVLVAPADSAVRLDIAPGMALAAALGGGRLAIADPGHVPAGRYAKAALVSLGLWKSVARRVALGQNVRETLVLVERGEAPLGIVYATDARASSRVRVVGAFPADSHPPIVYEVAVVAGRARPAVMAYLRHLESPEARAILQRHGFAAD